MPIAKCQNTRIENAERKVPCKRFFARIPDCVVTCLKDNPGEEMIFRCPTCPRDDRWCSIYANAKGGMVFRSRDDGPPDEPELEFEETLISDVYA
jgi:hypothetical protein